ncbi:uncharacterized protein LTR77_007542 [Saxophila tyrrhenica]|uniref:Heterokaryon incompatibility domain-containing protein n=1 Tax=Saxophila tyrrhenica TaxID=1690608 RepID=A0AAV9P500_9PEZI|nr:hypothetical protein LTR77_007542 [Saxophila tyrrhenica]
MWLLNVETRRLESFHHERYVPGGYAILSHTWGPDELTFDDIRLDVVPRKQGYKKIEYACQQAWKDDYHYVWIDTVCIDKRSSAELSEAINSMFRWYRSASVCYAYLSDVKLDSAGFEDPSTAGSPNERPPCPESNIHSLTEGARAIFGSLSKMPPGPENNMNSLPESSRASFEQSAWFTRSWTLQELIAPEKVSFFDCHWERLGDKEALAQSIERATGVDVAVILSSELLPTRSVARRMSWAAKRKASREEDQAYSLLGLFEIAMPMLYGEGGKKAFIRLQEEIIRSSAAADHSILAWMPDDPKLPREELLSPHPYGFRYARDIVSWRSQYGEVFEGSNQGLRISVPVSDKHAEFVEGSQEHMRRRAVEQSFYYEPSRGISADMYFYARQAPRCQPHRSDHAEDEWRFEAMMMSVVTSYPPSVISLAKQPQWNNFNRNFVHIVVDPGLFVAVRGSRPPEAWDKNTSILALGNAWLPGAIQFMKMAAAIVSHPSSFRGPNLALLIMVGGLAPWIAVFRWVDFEAMQRMPSAQECTVVPVTPVAVPLHGTDTPVLNASVREFGATGERIWSIHLSQPTPETKAALAPAKSASQKTTWTEKLLKKNSDTSSN